MRQDVDWEAAERSPEFQELVHARRRFVIPATIFFLSWYLGFILLAGYAQDFMGESVYEGLTVGYCLALTQFVMVGALGLMYLRRADRVYDPLAAAVVRRALDGHDPRTGQPAGTPTPPERDADVGADRPRRGPGGVGRLGDSR